MQGSDLLLPPCPIIEVVPRVLAKVIVIAVVTEVIVAVVAVVIIAIVITASYNKYSLYCILIAETDT